MYNDMLRDGIQEFVSMSSCRTLVDMIAKAQEQEIDLELLRKQVLFLVLEEEGSVKKPNTFDSQVRGQQGEGHYGKCGKPHHKVC